ncbi:MAG TPA: hypothetical protein PLJ26_06215 [Candidatus Omnitrophota bacterium]|nr:hypothetical protein [Candidatus Omnitrophota bacterium]
MKPGVSLRTFLCIAALFICIGSQAVIYAQQPVQDSAGEADAGEAEVQSDGVTAGPLAESGPVPSGPVMVPAVAPGTPVADASKNTAVTRITAVEGSSDTYSFELRDTRVLDLFRILSHDYKLNLLVDNSVSDAKVTASLSNVTLQEALEAISELAGLKMERKGSIIKVYVDIVTEVIALKYIPAKKILERTGSSTGSASSGMPPGMPGMGAATSGQTSESSIFDLLSPQGKILLGSQPNSIIVMDLPAYVERVRQYVSVVDQRMETRVFKLKYLKASDLVGDTVPSRGTASTASSSTASPATAAAGGAIVSTGTSM